MVFLTTIVKEMQLSKMYRTSMKELFLLLTAVAAIAITAKASDLYTVENGSYVSTDFQSLSLLLHTQHGTNRYRAIRDILISQGTLIPCEPGQVVEVITYNGNGIATILGRHDQTFYIPQEDFVRLLGSR
jgi:hypothetical protein